MNAPIILYLETATQVCSVCVAQGEHILAKRESEEGNKHSAHLALYIESCLKEAGVALKDLDAVAVCSGPGSYTGLRVGASTAKGLCFAQDKPLITIDNLQALAWGAMQTHQPASGTGIISMIDARRMEVYAASFGHDGDRKTENQPLILEDQNTLDIYLAGCDRLLLVGNGVEKAKKLYTDNPQIMCDSSLISRSEYMIGPALKKFASNDLADIYTFAPGYLKAPNITKSTKSIF